ncbi:MAG: FecR domain-containing protein [Flavobacteriales bacterium]
MYEGPHIDSDRLARYVADEATADERAQVERWAAADPAHARELAELRRVWALAEEGAVDAPDVDAAWAKLNARIAEAEGRGRVVPLRRPFIRWALGAAAVAAGLFFAVRVLFAPAVQEVMASSAFAHATLADSSRVVVSPGSSLEARMGDRRLVALKGEAYFEVHRDAAHPFVVEADGLTVTVLGTGFTVTAYDTSDVVRVRVRHGHVRVEADTAQVELLTGDEVLFDRRAKRLVRREVPSSVVWGDRIVQFEGAPMEQVAERLGRLFHVRVELRNPAIARCRLTASFDNEPIDAVLRVIAETFGLRVEETAPGRYTLDGDGC